MDVDSPSPKKCRRVNRGVQQMAVRRRRRSLENLQEMPMDVLYEVRRYVASLLVANRTLTVMS